MPVSFALRLSSRLAIPAAFASGIAALPGEEIRSPDGNLVAHLELTDGAPSLQVNYKGKVFLERSPLGLETSVGSFASGLAATDSKVREINEAYVLPHGKVHDVNYRANELTCRLTNSGNGILEILVRTSDHDVA